jgi:hypothetical protein
MPNTLGQKMERAPSIPPGAKLHAKINFMKNCDVSQRAEVRAQQTRAKNKGTA